MEKSFEGHNYERVAPGRNVSRLSFVLFPIDSGATTERNSNGPGANLTFAGCGRPLTLDVVVTDRSGKPVKGLEEKDFTVLDNGHPQKILSFQAAGSAAAVEGAAGENVPAAEPPARVILLVDEVNTNFTRIAYERDQIKRVLLQNGGKLAYPVSLAFFSDAGTQIQDETSRDGNALWVLFNQHETALRTNRRSSGFYGAVDRFQLSMSTLNLLAAKEKNQPGRKIVVWISPGWPILSGPYVQAEQQDSGMVVFVDRLHLD